MESANTSVKSTSRKGKGKSLKDKSQEVPDAEMIEKAWDKSR